MKRIKVKYGKHLVGELLARDGVHYFSYDREFLRNPLPLSPYDLPPIQGVTEHRNGYFFTLPGLCYDSHPDRFGMAVMRRRFLNKGVHSPTPLQMLGSLGNRTMGALTYEPCDERAEDQTSVDLVEAALSAGSVLVHEHGRKLDPAIATAGGTAGGATPKLLAAISPDGSRIITGSDKIPEGMEAWLVKLNTADKKDASLIQLEHAYFSMAEAAGLKVPATRLLIDQAGAPHFAIRRFDRDLTDPNRRIHIQTYAAIAGIDFREPTSDYENLLRLTKDLTRNHEEVVEQFRRMVFNVLACNRDDHAKNFSFCMNESGEWSLSPAYDLLYTDNDLGGNWMMVQGKRSGVTMDEFQRLARLMGLSRHELGLIMDQTRDALSQWKKFARNSGVGPGLSMVVNGMLAHAEKSL